MTIAQYLVEKTSLIGARAVDHVLALAGICGVGNGISDGVDIVTINIIEEEMVSVEILDTEDININITEEETIKISLED